MEAGMQQAPTPEMSTQSEPLVDTPIEYLEAMISNDSRGLSQIINAHLMTILELAEKGEPVPEQIRKSFYEKISALSTSSYELGKLQTIQHLSALYPDSVGKDYRKMGCTAPQAEQAEKVWKQQEQAMKAQEPKKS